MIFKDILIIFVKLVIYTQIAATLTEKDIIKLVLEKNANSFAENRRKTPKMVIITLNPDCVAISWYKKIIRLSPLTAVYMTI
jgi:hypothetical protein